MTEGLQKPPERTGKKTVFESLVLKGAAFLVTSQGFLQALIGSVWAGFWCPLRILQVVACLYRFQLVFASGGLDPDGCS